jgi:hypothetical protein
MGLKTVLTEDLLRKLKKKKKPANPNLRTGTKQSRKNLIKKVMEKNKRKPAGPKKPKRLYSRANET